MSKDKKPAIMCVDDEQGIVDSLYDTFSEKYDVKKAASGEEALKIFDEEEIRVVISDQRMPGMEGSELFAEINKKKPYVKKILLTGYADINAAARAINEGSIDKYFNKPWDHRELIKAVDHLSGMYKFDAFLAKMKEESKIILEDEHGMRKLISSYEFFLDGDLSGVCVADSEEKIAFINSRGCEILKIANPDCVRGKDMSTIFPIDSKEKLESVDEMEAFTAEGSALALSVMLRCRNDSSTDGIKLCGIVFNEK